MCVVVSEKPLAAVAEEPAEVCGPLLKAAKRFLVPLIESRII